MTFPSKVTSGQAQPVYGPLTKEQTQIQEKLSGVMSGHEATKGAIDEKMKGLQEKMTTATATASQTLAELDFEKGLKKTQIPRLSSDLASEKAATSKIAKKQAKNITSLKGKISKLEKEITSANAKLEKVKQEIDKLISDGKLEKANKKLIDLQKQGTTLTSLKGRCIQLTEELQKSETQAKGAMGKLDVIKHLGQAQLKHSLFMSLYERDKGSIEHGEFQSSRMFGQSEAASFTAKNYELEAIEHNYKQISLDDPTQSNQVLDRLKSIINVFQDARAILLDDKAQAKFDQLQSMVEKAVVFAKFSKEIPDKPEYQPLRDKLKTLSKQEKEAREILAKREQSGIASLTDNEIETVKKYQNALEEATKMIITYKMHINGSISRFDFNNYKLD